MSKEIIDKVLSGLSDKNIRFEDLRKLLLSLGFDERIKGDHHIFTKPDIIEIINNEEPCGKTAGYLNVRNFSLSYSLAKPRSKQAVRQM